MTGHTQSISRTANGQARRKLQNIEITLTDGILQAALNSRNIVYAEDIRTDSRFGGKHDTLLGEDCVIGKSFIVPLYPCSGKRPLGLLALYDIQPMEQIDYYRCLLQSFATILAFTIERLKLVRDLKREALTDHLTGLHNRRSLVSIVDREIEQCLRYDRPISFVLIDVDNFKSINDTDGHLHGDAVLVNLAEILHKSVRRLDYVIRFAGDEFVVLMPDTSERQMSEIIYRIKENFGSQKLPATVKYAISIGSYSGSPQSLQHMFVKADKEMYKQKVAHKQKQTEVVRHSVL